MKWKGIHIKDLEAIKPKVIKAGEFLENGDPSKDAIGAWEADVALCWLAELIRSGKAEPWND